MYSDTEQFYPTPPELVFKAQELFKRKLGSIDNEILEPSCGSGSLLKIPSSRQSYRLKEFFTADACEINNDRLIELERVENINVVGHDFLQFNPSKKYSHVLMNPPFNMGVKHLLHAWDIGYNTEIVCILNAASIKNATTSDQKVLSDLIEQYGSVEYIQNSFSNAERKTDVEIALIYLHKKTEVNTHYLDGLNLDKYEPEFTGFQSENSLAIPDNVIENAVRIYNQSRSVLEVMVESSAVLNAKYAAISGLLGTSILASEEEMKKYNTGLEKQRNGGTSSAITSRYNEEIKSLKKSAWSYVLKGLNVENKLTSKARDDFHAQFNKVSQLEFTESNIHGFLSGLAYSRGKMMDDALLELFDRFTGSHHNNRLYYKSWKSNDRHKTAAFRLKHTRVVMPMRIFCSYSTKADWEAVRELADIDKAMALLDGKDVKDIRGLEYHIKDTSQIGKRFSTDYFDVRLFMNGNVHLFPRRMDLIERLNRTVGKLRQWLPEEDNHATSEFWKHYKSEVTTKDIDLDDVRRSNWGDHVCEDKVMAAVDKSLKKQNIDCDSFVNELEFSKTKEIG